MRETDLLKVIVISALAFVFGIYIIGSMDKTQSKDMQRIDKMSELVRKETKNKEKTVKKAKSENATCYIDGIKQDSAFDPDGLNIYDYDISYKNNRLYFKTIKKSEYTPSMNNGSGWYFPLYFPVFR